MIDQYDTVILLTDTANRCGWAVVSAESSDEQITVILRRDARPENITTTTTQGDADGST